MSTRHAKDAVVKLGSATVVGIGNWSIDGITTDQVDASALGDNWMSYKFGMKDGGTITFAGLADPADTTGQEALEIANIENTELTTLRLYVDDTSYYEPCQTTGYFSPASTTGNDTTVSYVNVTGYNISADKSGMVNISFNCKVSGMMVLV